MTTIQQATFGAGCFWGVEWVFRKVPGVLDAVSGYAGGDVADPSYRQVCTGMTGHAEVVDVTFDADVIAFDQLLDVFWAMHDPTQVDRQGPDRGSQYRSTILIRDEEQRSIAAASRDRAQAAFRKPIATTIEDLDMFYPAEAYHQQYYDLNGHQPYCHVFPADVVERLGLVRS